MRPALLAVTGALLLATSGCGDEDRAPERARADALAERTERLRAETARLAERARRLEAEAATRAAPSPRERAVGARDGAGRALGAGAGDSLARLGRAEGARLAVAVAPVGGGAGDRAGPQDAVAAWSTAKVPLAVAASRAGDPVEADVEAAITTSDNAAAGRLWSVLGSGTAASAAVEAVLADGGDRRTAVPAAPPWAGFSAVGQTMWSPVAQARWLGRVACRDDAADVLDAAGRVQQDQRWGLGALGDGVRLKGGWGPGPGGEYLVRQMAIVPREGGAVAVALVARPDDGAFATGVGALDAAATWVDGRLGTAAGGTC